MKLIFCSLIICCILVPVLEAQGQSPETKHRVLILTDIENEPDDAESLVRFLLYSNMFDVEGLIATTSCWQRDEIADWRIYEILDAYGKVRDNLEQHEQGYPDTGYLRSVTKRGYPDFGMNAVGEGKESEGSDWIIEVVDRDAHRPVWIPIWGGANCLAQALWKVKNTRSEEELAEFVSRIRVYTISDQDDSGPWMRNTFPELFYICSPGYHENGGQSYYFATWIGISGERHYKFPSGSDQYIVSNDWVDEHIQNHGPLGAEYPDIAYIMEGDTPSFLYLVNNGLNVPEHPDYGSWGGRYAFYTPAARNFFHEPETRPFWTNTSDMVTGKDGLIYVDEQATIWRWREAFQNDFAARMDWTIQAFEEANHPPVARIDKGHLVNVFSGEKVNLNAEDSEDPDGDDLSFEWLYYKEAGSYGGNLEMDGVRNPVMSFTVPDVDQSEIIHIILSVTDNGSPPLTRYRRLIVNILPKVE